MWSQQFTVSTNMGRYGHWLINPSSSRLACYHVKAEAQAFVISLESPNTGLQMSYEWNRISTKYLWSHLNTCNVSCRTHKRLQAMTAAAVGPPPLPTRPAQLHQHLRSPQARRMSKAAVKTMARFAPNDFCILCYCPLFLQVLKLAR